MQIESFKEQLHDLCIRATRDEGLDAGEVSQCLISYGSSKQSLEANDATLDVDYLMENGLLLLSPLAGENRESHDLSEAGPSKFARTSSTCMTPRHGRLHSLSEGLERHLFPVTDESLLTFFDSLQADEHHDDGPQQLQLHHDCQFEGTRRSELCNQEACMKDYYRSGRDLLMISSCGRPISVILPLNPSAQDLTVEVVDLDGRPATEFTLMNMETNLQGTSLTSLSARQLNSLKIQGRSTKTGSSQFKFQVRLKITLCTGPKPFQFPPTKASCQNRSVTRSLPSHLERI